jgi:hypothetical protein
MPDIDQTADPFVAATAAAVEDILAAMDATASPGEAGASGETVGHGRIRLRTPASPAATGVGHPATGPAAGADAVGHGTIRLRG